MNPVKFEIITTVRIKSVRMNVINIFDISSIINKVLPI